MADESIRLVHASGECEIDLGRRELRVLGSAVPVGGRAFEIIEVLARSAGELVTKDELMDRVWPGAIVTENTLQVHTMAIRKALGPYRTLLKTQSGRGYRLLGDWTVRRHEAAKPPAGLQRMQVAGESPVTNFPTAVTRLVGRRAAVARLRDLISAYRVVTLTGPGGIGKTSLALKATRGMVGEFADGGWLIELAPLSDPTLVAAAVAAVLRLPLGLESGGLEAVARAIGDKKLLLVLDNCEHVIDAVARLSETFVRRCPGVTIVATSREFLRIDGEYVYRVSSLDVPPPGRDEADHILNHSAVELFIARTQALDAGFSPRADELPIVGEICRHLDGIPLAIEFAAAHASSFGVQQVAVDLHDRFALLTRGRRAAPPRHRTLRGVLDWSYELLPEAEQRLLRHLAVFSGGFTVAAAAAVVNDDGVDLSSVIECIANLVAKSLVALDRGTPSRWYLLETIRIYALEKLTKESERDCAARRHAAYFGDRFAPLTTSDGSRLSADEVADVVREIDNVRAALDWSFSAGGDRPTGIALTAAYAQVWAVLTLTDERRARCERALHDFYPRTNQDRRVQMWLRISLASALRTMGAVERALAIATLALEAADSLNDPDGQARSLREVISAYSFSGDHARAGPTVERLASIAHQIGDPSVRRMADRLAGIWLLDAGRPAAAQRHLESSLRSYRPAEDRRRSLWYSHDHHAPAQALLARALWLRGFPEQARKEALASLEAAQATGRGVLFCMTADYGICRFAPMIGDFDTAQQTTTSLLEIATNLNSRFWHTRGRFLQGKLMVQRGEFTDGVNVLRDAFETCRQTGWRLSFPEYKGTLSVALCGLGLYDEALAVVDDALRDTGDALNGDRVYVPELLRIKGDILLRRRAVTAAEDSLREALDTARQQQALFWELRAALSLARLHAHQGPGDEARQLLAQVYDRFTEGFETPDLRAAKALLDELRD